MKILSNKINTHKVINLVSKKRTSICNVTSGGPTKGKMRKRQKNDSENEKRHDSIPDPRTLQFSPIDTSSEVNEENATLERNFLLTSLTGHQMPP